MSVGTQQYVEILLDGNSSLSKKPVVNNFHYSQPGTTGATKDALNSIFRSQVLPKILAILHTTYSLPRIRIRFVDDPSDPYQDYTGTDVGSASGTAAPTNMAAFYWFRTGQRKPRLSGGKHFSPILATDIDGDDLKKTMGSIDAKFTDLLSACVGTLYDSNGITWTPIVLSRKYSPGLLVAGGGINSQPFTDKVDLTLGTMRHRREKTIRY